MAMAKRYRENCVGHGAQVACTSKVESGVLKGHNRVGEIQWCQTDLRRFSPVVGHELYWTWSSADRENFSYRAFDGSVCLVTLVEVRSNGKCQIKFRCGHKREMSMATLRLACIEHNKYVQDPSQAMVNHRTKALLEKIDDTRSERGEYSYMSIVRIKFPF